MEALFGKPPRSRNLALTPELVALTIRPIEDPGPPPGVSYLEEHEYPPLIAATLAEAPAGDFWLFAFGSLIWKPGCSFVEERMGHVRGWHRAFRLGFDTRWRGNEEHPNLMMGLCRGGQCTGMLYRLPPEAVEENLNALFHREIRMRPPAGRPMTQAPRWLTVATGSGSVRAIAFVLDHRGVAYQGKRSHEETADILSKSCGTNGSGAEYLYKTVAKLAEHGIYDRNLWRLQELVAEKIRTRHRLA